MLKQTLNGACATCMQSMTICRSCGKRIKREYIEINGAGRYCKDCYNQRNHCNVCGAPLTDEHWLLSDKRVSCGYCHTTAVYNPNEATALYEEMKNLIKQNFGLQLNIPTGLALVDRKQLANIILKQSQAQPNRHGVEDLDPEKTLGVYTRRGMKRGIYIQTGLPRTILLQIAAHEFAHAWQGENCPVLREELVHEGFAEWVAYKVLGLYGYKQQQSQMTQRNDIYGKGLNWALAIDSKYGVEGVIDACLNTKQASGGP